MRFHIQRRLSESKSKECMWRNHHRSALLQNTSPCHRWRCQSRQGGQPGWFHRKSEGFHCLCRRTAAPPLGSVARNTGNSQCTMTEPGDHRTGGSWWPCSAEGDRWPHTGHRPSQSGEGHPVPQTVRKNTSGWCSLHRSCLCCESGCSTASLGWWWRWSRCLQRTGWRGRSTWGCGGGSLSWQPGWWAGFQTQWSGTWGEKAQIWGAAVLVPLIIPEEEILKPVCYYWFHKVDVMTRKEKNNMTNFHTNAHY